MALKAIVDSVEGFADEIKAEYKIRDDGKYVLDVEAVGSTALEDIGGLKSALEKTRGERGALTGKLKEFDGFDMSEAREALKKVEDMKNWNPDEEVAKKIEVKLAEMAKLHEKEKQELINHGGKTESQLKKLLITQAATEALLSEKGSVQLLLPHVEKNVRLKQNETSGEYVVEVVNEQGLQRVGDSQGNPMTIPQFVAEMKKNDEFARAFEGTGQTGTGAGDATPAGTPAPSGAILRIPRSNQDMMNQNVDKIASGEAVVVDG